MARRRCLFLVSAVLPVGSPCLAVYLKYKTDLEWWYAVLFLVVILLAAIIFNFYAWIKPVRDIEGAFASALDVIGGSLRIHAKRCDGVRVRINVMVPHRPLSDCFRKHLHIVWSLGMENQPDIKASFHISKGVAGKAFASKEKHLVEFDGVTHSDFGFTKKEIENFGLDKISGILSFPIYALDSKNKQTDKVVGILNLDTREQNGIQKIHKKIEKYSNLLDGLVDCVSKAASK